MIMFNFILRRIKSKKIIAEYFINNNTVKINFGCGANPLAGWLNCDSDPLPGVCYVNCAGKLPFSGSCADYIYSEHLIEHLRLNEFIAFLKECYRVLKTSGKIRLVTPNLKAFLDMYKGNADSDIYLQWYAKRKMPDMPFSSVNCLNSMFYEHGHKFIYDYDYLEKLMSHCGFKEVQQCEIQKSREPVFDNLGRHGKTIGDGINAIESLAVEAVK